MSCMVTTSRTSESQVSLINPEPITLVKVKDTGGTFTAVNPRSYYYYFNGEFDLSKFKGASSTLCLLGFKICACRGDGVGYDGAARLDVSGITVSGTGQTVKFFIDSISGDNGTTWRNIDNGLISSSGSSVMFMYPYINSGTMEEQKRGTCIEITDPFFVTASSLKVKYKMTIEDAGNDTSAPVTWKGYQYARTQRLDSYLFDCYVI